MSKQQSPQALAAKAIRKELKAAFPGVKFSVRSESFAGGNSVDIFYEDGPVIGDVEAVVGKYQYGSFNGMEDLYEYDNCSDDLPQAKYVQVSRHITDEKRQMVKEEVAAEFGIENPEDSNEWEGVFGLYRDIVVGRELYKRSFEV